MKKIVSFVNPNFQQGPKEFNAFYLPYSPAIIWSYAYQFDQVKDNYSLGTFIWHRDPIEVAIEKLKTSTIVGFSTYIWNKNYNNTLAKKLKEINPNVLIVFGGPEPAIEKPNFFELHPYIDICCKQEGEITWKLILENFHEKSWSKIPGIIYKDTSGSTVDTGPGQRLSEEQLDKIPSPYLTGLFDQLLIDYPEITWNATLETNRGCPYACTFCDWGSLTYNKVKKFSLERVFAELEWIGSKRCDFVSITDANFGIFPERDSLIADKLIEVQKKYGFPKAYTISWAKNQKREIIEIVKKLINEGGAKIGLNLSVQTMNEEVLDNIKRKNLEQHKIKEVFDLCEKNNIPLFTELILGLPGETLDSWKNNFYQLFEAGNHTGITIYQAQLLENAEMNLVQKKLFKINGSVVYDYIVGAYNENEVKEGIEVVVSTKDLPPDVMLQAQVFSWLMNTFHINGFTNYISRFLKKYQGVEYAEFYEKFFAYIKADDFLSNEIKRIETHYKKWSTHGKIDHELIQGLEIHGWNLIHSSIINIQSQNKVKDIFALIKKFVKENFNLDQDIFDDLLTLQENFIINFHNKKEYPKQIEFKNDILSYIIKNSSLESNVVYQFDFPEDKEMSLQHFCEQIFFARRRNFGKAWVTKYES